MKVRVGTFNAENLFARFKFKGKRVKKAGKTVYQPWTPAELDNLAKDGWAVDKTRFDSFTKGKQTRLTGLAVKGINADILGLQEIEAMDTLKKFVTEQLNTQRYKYKILIDANDPRFIDVALLVKEKFSIAYIRTHQFERTKNNKAFVFSRDCLEVGVQLSQNTVLPVFVNHFKSMMGGRSQTMARRKLQSEKVVEILRQRFGNNPGNAAWVVVGDLNDYLPSSGLAPLLGQPWAVNVVERLPVADRWTHFWAQKKEYRQLDYILLSRALADANPNAKPYVERRGMPERANVPKYFPGIQGTNYKASDHCPVAVEINV